MAYLLITRPNHDLATTYLYVWSQEIISLAKAKGIAIIDLEKEKVTRLSLEEYLANKRVGFVFMNGHGSEDRIGGYLDETIIDESTKPELVKSSIIYARSCNAGKKLGVVLVNKGVRAFIGYKTNFSFHFTVGSTTRPKEDRLAAKFLMPSNIVGSTLLKGGTAEEAHQRSKKLMTQNLYSLLSSTDKTFKDAAPAMYYNIMGQVLIGDPTAKI